MAYDQQVIDRYENPKHAGSLDKNSKNVGTGLVGAPACGDVLKLQIEVDPVTQTIVDAKFKTFGCMAVIASSDFTAEEIKGKTIGEALKVKNSYIASTLNLPPVKLHCSVLAEDAIQAAIQDYKAKQGIADVPSEEGA